MSTDPPDVSAIPKPPAPPPDRQHREEPPPDEPENTEDGEGGAGKDGQKDSAPQPAEDEPEYSGEDKARARLLRDDAAWSMLASTDRSMYRAEAGRDNVQGDVNNTFNVMAEDLAALRRSISGPVDGAYLDHLLTVHVMNDSFGALVGEVRKHSVVILAGRANTGRRHSALRALDELGDRSRNPSPIHIVSTGTPLDDLVKNVRQGQSYVWDASGADWAFHVDQAVIWRLTQQVAERDSRLVVLVDEPWLLDVDLPQVIHHRSPDQWDVTRSHLQTHLPESDRVLSDAGKFAQVNAWLRTGRGPAVAVSLAASIALWHRFDRPGGAAVGTHDRGPQPASLHRKFALRQARSLLRQSIGNRSEGWTPRSQSLVLASAVLDGQPLASVIRAAEDLRRRLTQAEAPDRPVGCDVFEAPLKHWLRHADITDEYVPSVVLNGEKGSWTTDPLVRLNDPLLATCILEAAWQDYDLLRDPLLEWLRDLCRRGTASEHSLAAIAVGRLAVVDFGTLRDEMLERWAGSGSPRAQAAAAWALEIVALAGDAAETEAVRLIDSWAQVPGWRRWTALRALGTRVAQQDRDKTFRQLAEAARTGPPKQDQLIQDALVDSYFGGLKHEVLAQLHEWSRGPAPQRRRAASAFLELTQLPAEESAVSVPDVLVRTIDNDQFAQLGELWLMALAEPTTRYRAWRYLLEWAELTGAKEGFPALREQLERSDLIAARLRLWDQIQYFRVA